MRFMREDRLKRRRLRATLILQRRSSIVTAKGKRRISQMSHRIDRTCRFVDTLSHLHAFRKKFRHHFFASDVIGRGGEDAEVSTTLIVDHLTRTDVKGRGKIIRDEIIGIRMAGQRVIRREFLKTRCARSVTSVGELNLLASGSRVPAGRRRVLTTRPTVQHNKRDRARSEPRRVKSRTRTRSGKPRHCFRKKVRLAVTGIRRREVWRIGIDGFLERRA